MFCLLFHLFDVLLLSQSLSILIVHGRVQCRALPPRPGHACCLQPLQNQALCRVLALYRPDIGLCKCSLVVCSCLSLLLNKQSNPGRCMVQTRDFCKLKTLLAFLQTQQPCTSNLSFLPLLPQFLSILIILTAQHYDLSFIDLQISCHYTMKKKFGIKAKQCGPHQEMSQLAARLVEVTAIGFMGGKRSKKGNYQTRGR